MTDALALRRLKRLTMLAAGHLRTLLWKALPYIVVFVFGVMNGTGYEGQRIHNDCKFTGTFRINYTGYTCHIGG